MKVLVQNPLTLSYFAKAGRWTSNPDLACAFTDSRSAIRFCLEHDLADMQIVLKGEQERFDMQLPVSSYAPAGASFQAW